MAALDHALHHVWCIRFCHTWFLDLCERSSFLTFWWILLHARKQKYVSVVYNIDKVSLNKLYVILSVQNKEPTQRIVIPLKQHVNLLWVFVRRCWCSFISSHSHLDCDVQVRENHHQGSNFASKVRDSSVTLICWPLKKKKALRACVSKLFAVGTSP